MADGKNGCVKFVEIATQTVNLTHLASKLNTSLTNCNNISEACMDQASISSIPTSPEVTLNDEKNDTIIHQPYKQQHRQNSNGHCIVDNQMNNSIDDMKCAQSSSSSSTTQVHDKEKSVDTDTIASTEIKSTIETLDCGTNMSIIRSYETIALPSSSPSSSSMSLNKIDAEVGSNADENSQEKNIITTDAFNGSPNDLCV